MKRAKCEGSCPCGETIKFTIDKPTRMQHTVAKVKCSVCKSQFLVSAKVEKDKPGRHYKTDIQIDNLTEAGARALSDRLASGIEDEPRSAD